MEGDRHLSLFYYSPLRIQDVQVWVMAEWYSAPTVTQLLAQSAVTSYKELSFSTGLHEISSLIK